MVGAIIAVLVILWLLGYFVINISSGLIHVLLVIALVVFIYNMLTGRRAL